MRTDGEEHHSSEVSFATTIPSEWRDRFAELCHRHRLKVREAVIGLVEFFETFEKHHPEFAMEGYRVFRRRSRKQSPDRGST
jgi:hypothetical protein